MSEKIKEVEKEVKEDVKKEVKEEASSLSKKELLDLIEDKDKQISNLESRLRRIKSQGVPRGMGR